MELETTETVSLDDAVDLGVDAGLDGGSEVESDAEPTLDDMLTETLLGDDDDDEISWEDDEDVVEEPAVDPEAPATYVVKVDGEEIEVTLDELLGGYQRQADYTRKTQTLASEREELQAFKRFDDALRTNPEGTLRALAENLGIELGQAVAPTPVEEQGYVDPLEQSVQALQAEIESLKAERQAEAAAQENAARLAAVDAELDAVRAKANDPKFDETALLQFALDNRIGSLDVAYKAMRAIAAEEAASSETARIEEKKRTLPPVEGGRARSVGSTRSGAGGRMTFEQALEAAINGS